MTEPLGRSDEYYLAMAAQVMEQLERERAATDGKAGPDD
jgi:hypothetical protein